MKARVRLPSDCATPWAGRCPQEEGKEEGKIEIEGLKQGHVEIDLAFINRHSVGISADVNTSIYVC